MPAPLPGRCAARAPLCSAECERLGESMGTCDPPDVAFDFSLSSGAGGREMGIFEEVRV